jgi:hypothetical protein
MHRRAAVWLQIGAGGQQLACRLVPASAHEYLRGRPKRCSGGQQRASRLVPASAHEYLRGRPKRCSGGHQRSPTRCSGGSSVAADWRRPASMNTCVGGEKDVAVRAAARLQIGAGKRA